MRMHINLIITPTPELFDWLASLTYVVPVLKEGARAAAGSARAACLAMGCFVDLYACVLFECAFTCEWKCTIAVWHVHVNRDRDMY